ncbi:MAG: arginine N-succinyltransferase [Alphaproteobacteria bacterium]|nr:arginine N-succinyltransferase [Alphaproteobacteria bacterium]
MNTADPATPPQKKGLGTGAVILIAAAVSVVTVWLCFTLLFPSSIRPVTLDAQEQAALQKKVRTLHLDLETAPAAAQGGRDERVLEPEPYSEENAQRDITFTEREVNARLATNTDLAGKVAIDLSAGLVSAKALIPLDPDMPVFGGKTLKISAGMALGFKNGRPQVILRGVSVWGVPIPNDWLGQLKNVDLVEQYGDAGFWKSFAAGVDNIAVGNGTLTIRLRE